MRSPANTAIKTGALILALFTALLQPGQAQAPSDIPVNGPTPPTYLQPLDEQVKDLLRSWDIPGGTIAICKGGQVLFARGYGYADRDSALPVIAEKSLFRIASISKPITACAVLKLVEQNKLHLDDRAFDLLAPDLIKHSRDKRLQSITVRDLLNMTAGWDKEFSGDPILQPFINRAAQRLHVPGPSDFNTTMRYMVTKRLDFTPGTSFAYSNFAYGVLGALVERASGENYQSFVQRTIFDPCSVKLPPGRTLKQDRLPDEVVYYAPLEHDAGPFLPCQQKRVSAPYARAYLEADLPTIGWLSSAPQLALLLDKMLSDVNVLSAASKEQIFQRPAINAWQGRKRFFSMGWEVVADAADAEYKYLYKDGTLPGSRAFAVHTASGITWVALFNARPLQKKADRFAHQLQEMMAGALNALPVSSP
jgi:CubicO group peptidase (beta-lactamase class C family)